MITSLRLRAHVRLPPGRSGAFDHGDVDSLTRRLFVAHTDFGTVDVIDPDSSEAVGTIAGCPEGSGVLCAAAPRQVFAASRGSGKVLLIDPDQLHTIGEVAVGPKPNGLAWAATRGLLLVADVDPADKAARLVDPLSLEVTAQTPLPGRPRWCVFDDRSDRFLVNIRDPASLISLATSGEISGSWPISSSGPHGLDLDREHGLAFVACDGGHIVIVDPVDGREVAAVPISGQPDASWFNPRRRRLYVGIASPGLLEVVDTDRGLLVESIATEPGAKTSAFDVKRQRLYVFLPESCAAVYEES